MLVHEVPHKLQVCMPRHGNWTENLSLSQQPSRKIGFESRGSKDGAPRKVGHSTKQKLERSEMALAAADCHSSPAGAGRESGASEEVCFFNGLTGNIAPRDPGSSVAELAETRAGRRTRAVRLQ